MEQVLLKNIDSGSVLAVCSIVQNLDWLLENSNPQRRSYALSLKSDRRRVEWLSWQTLLVQVLGTDEFETGYRACGAPYIIGDARHLSVSHCRGYVAILVSDGACGLDIELGSRDFSKASERFAREDVTDDLALVWSAKEAVFKYLEDVEVAMLTDIVVDSIGESSIDSHVGEECYNLSYLRIDKLNVVYLLKNKQSH